MRGLSLGTGLFALLCFARSASAQNPAAVALFDQGRAALAAGDLETACARFRESNKLEPRPGPAANLGKCEEQRGHLASAWAAYREAIGHMTEGDERKPVLEGLVESLEPRLPRIVLELPPAAPQGTSVTEGAATLSVSSAPLPIDPGNHRFVVHAPGRADRVIDVIFAERELKHVWAEPGPAAGAVPLPPPSPGLVPVTAPAAASSGPGAGPWVVGGIGVASLIAGAVTAGLLAKDKSDNGAGCNPTTRICTLAGQQAAAAGRTVGPVAAAALAVGGAGVAASAIWLGLARSAKDRVGVGVGPVLGGAAVHVEGSW